MTYALDTGFFYQLLSDPSDTTVQEAWAEIGRGEIEGVLSCITCFELCRHGLRGSLPKEPIEVLLKDLPQVCVVVVIERLSRCERAARLAHGNGLSMADAFILEAALACKANQLYTTDTDFADYEGDIEVVLV